MDWFYCEECGAKFTEDDVMIVREEERHSWLDDCPVEIRHEWLCPDCGSGCIQECDYCDWCGDPFRPGELIDGICERCRKELELEDE